MCWGWWGVSICKKKCPKKTPKQQWKWHQHSRTRALEMCDWEWLRLVIRSTVEYANAWWSYHPGWLAPPHKHQMSPATKCALGRFFLHWAGRSALLYNRFHYLSHASKVFLLFFFFDFSGLLSSFPLLFICICAKTGGPWGQSRLEKEMPSGACITK